MCRKVDSVIKTALMLGLLLSVGACSIDQAETNKNASGPFFHDNYAHKPPSGTEDMFGDMPSAYPASPHP